MKKLILLLLFTIVSFAQVPQGMSHRGVAYDSSGNILSNTQINLRVKIFEGSVTGSLVFEEIHTTVNNNPTQLLTTSQNGQYNIVIGNGAQQGSNSFSSINWGGGQKWLEIGIASATNPTNFVTGSSQLMSVPYALYTEKSSSLNMVTLNTVSELRILNTHEKENLVYVKGYWYPGDGGGGFFSYKTYGPNDVIPNDNDGTIFKPVNANGRWIRQYNGFINARFFGVTKGFEYTGSSNFSNSEQIQKAIDFASNNSIYSDEIGGMTLFFPNGTYLIDKKIILKSKIRLIGESGTMFVNHDGNYDYMFGLDKGEITEFSMENFILNLNNKENVGGFHLKSDYSINNGPGGLWFAGFKNLHIINLKGNGIYLEGGDLSSNYKLPNQFIVFEKIRIVRQTIDHNAFKITGQHGQLTFINCGFDGIRNQGVNFSIKKFNSFQDLNSSVISFLNCTFQDSEYGVDLKDVENITFDNCWFENLDIAIQIKDSKQVGVLNSHFANASGFGSLTGSLIPQGYGRCIDIENSFVNIERNYIGVSDYNSNLIDGEKFIKGEGNNNTINLIDNVFQDIKLSETFGVIQTTTISNNTINLGSKKNVFVNLLPGSQTNTNQINRIDSSVGGGETIFIRANGSSMQINAMDLSGLTNKNIFLNGSNSLVLNNGETALFKKIDFITGSEKCTYQLVSVSKNEDSGWYNVTTFFNTVTNYDASSTIRCRNKKGVVYLDGSIKGGASQTNGLTYQLFRLPEGFWPSRKCSFPIIKAGNTTGTVATLTVVGRIDIDVNGYVFGVNYSNIWSNLSGITFVVD